MSQPVWITPAGPLGVIPEGIFYRQTMLANSEPLFEITCTATSAVTNRITCNSTADMYAELDIEFSGNVFGGIVPGRRYYVISVVNATQFVIGETAESNTPIELTTATGSMTADLRQQVYYKIISGTLPLGIQCSANGLIIGVPKAVASLQGVPFPVNRNVTSKLHSEPTQKILSTMHLYWIVLEIEHLNSLSPATMFRCLLLLQDRLPATIQPHLPVL